MKCVLPAKNVFVIAILITACGGTRMSQPKPTSQQALPPQATAPTTRIPATPPPPQATPPSPVCPDAGPTSPLGRLRSAMRNTSFTQMNAYFDAFLIFYSDEHLSEEPAAEERRLEYISGWDGAGTAAVMADGGAALWVPVGDVRRARAAVSCAWVVFDDDPARTTFAEWISGRLGRRNGHIGADARLTSVTEWQVLSSSLQDEGQQLVHVPTLIDQLWNEETNPKRRRPDFNRIVANLHNADYTGLSWRDKVSLVRNELQQLGAEGMIVTALDEVAWLLNVRGRDVPHAPLLKAFVLIGSKEVRVYAPAGKLSMPVREALAVYSCYTLNANCTRVIDYSEVYADLRRASDQRILIPNGGTFQRGASAAIAQAVPQNKRLFQLSPIIYLKAQKNEAEIKGMKKAHLRDAVAMCTVLNYIDGMMKSGSMDELSVARKVDETRDTQAGFVGLSMKTRVAFGPNGADAEYYATNRTNRRLYKNSTLVIQSGGQYEEGTTVVMRTLHFGIPTHSERRAYTTTLRAAAALATLLPPATLPAAHADPAARAPLWAKHQDYPHPTGHGVGAALNRREDPVVIDYRQDKILHIFKEGYFITSEPAWYESDKFGVRLGNVLEVVPKENGYLGFLETTLVPYEPKLIDRSLLTEYEINWLNGYNDRIRKIVGPELRDQGLMDVYYWMTNKTIHIEPSYKSKRAPNSSLSLVVQGPSTAVVLAVLSMLAML